MSENHLQLRCDQCGEMNRLPVVHCAKCGAKLDFDAAERRIVRGASGSIGAQLRTWLKLLLVVVLAAVVLLAMWPSTLERATGEVKDARRYRMKMEVLWAAIDRGEPASQPFTEPEVNAYLREIVVAQPKREGMAAGLDDLGVALANGRARVLVAIGRGPFTFSSLYAIGVQDDRFVVQGVQFGHLPLPGPLGGWYAKSQRKLLQQFKTEAAVLDRLTGVLLSDDAAELLVQ